MDTRLQTFYAIQNAKKQQEKDQKIYELQQGLEGLEEKKRLLDLEEAEQRQAEVDIRIHINNLDSLSNGVNEGRNTDGLAGFNFVSWWRLEKNCRI
jgi:transcriptional regulator of heat shock response